MRSDLEGAGRAPADRLPGQSPGVRERGAPLQRLYQSYLDRQASAFLSVIPKEGIRPLYRVARSWARAEGVHETKDPLATLLKYLSVRLPLPPYAVWLADFQANRDAHLEAMDAPGPGPEAAGPVTVDIRSVEAGGTWYAALGVYRQSDSWRGFISFRREDESEQVRTSDIFRGDGADEIRSRFRSFDDETLTAFLRSALP